ncbi:ImmA/IrrE family metallo-endopeptidase [Aeoliella sp. SH292]|uniref:ImmA/IrrE family metallo-endopeptidase n=1 Tax=Aeoliella sp. SH292 TaxID=3454464 RepID=UPI003F97292A
MFSSYLEAFEHLQPLRQRVLHVLRALPAEVQQDFLTDTCFNVLLDNYAPGEGSMVFMAVSGEGGISSRSVVLRPRLSDCDEAFAYYVIAHEFAHAYLRNGPWGDIADCEEAADALAAHWGFLMPVS